VNGRAVIAAACAFCAACSLFVDTGEFTAGGDGTDAGAGTESSTTDVTDVAEGGVDARDATTDAVIPAEPCPPGAFCDDFEKRGDVKGTWTAETIKGGCGLVLDGTTSDRGSSSLKNTLVATPEAEQCEGYLTRHIALAPGKITLSVSIRIAANVDRYLHILGMNFPSPSRALFMVLASEGLILAEQQFEAPTGANSYLVGLAPFTPGTFHRVVLEHDVATRNTIVSIDGTKRLEKVLVRSMVTTNFGVTLGSNYNKGGPALDLWFDDFRLVTQPL
jgi:hypothetical protein